MRRPSWLTRHPIQSKYLFIVMMSMLCPTIVLASLLYFVIFTLMAEQFALPEGIYIMLMLVFYKVNLFMIIGMPIMFIVVFLWGLFISHRFAGPILRMEKDLDEILSGNWNKTIKLRKKDDLAGVADRVNKIIAMKRSG